MSDKKRSERWFLERFLEARPEYTLVDPEAERERPDFILRDAQGLIGLEVTQLFVDEAASGSGRKARESQRGKYLALVHRAYLALGGLPISLRADFDSVPPEAPQVLAERLVLARSQEVAAEAEVTLASGATFRIWSLPGAVGECGLWSIMQDHGPATVGHITADLLNARIERKARELDGYREAAQRVGLLLYVERNRASGFLRFREELVDALDARGFEAVFLLFAPGNVWRVALASSTCSAQ